jgi:hypothetical protein
MANLNNKKEKNLHFMEKSLVGLIPGVTLAFAVVECNLRCLIRLPYILYLRISREILDKFWTKYYQFDSYVGQTFLTQKYILVSFSYFLRPKKRGSTYTRVYTVSGQGKLK